MFLYLRAQMQEQTNVAQEKEDDLGAQKKPAKKAKGAKSA